MRETVLILVWLLANPAGSYLQDIKPLAATPTTGETYAIVVGISSYRYIKPLSYADKDADLFTDLLRSQAGGKIKSENLFLLKNDSANAGNFWSALQRICNKKLTNKDRVYIYFAGHGDALKGLNEYYLLLSDCQPANDVNNYHLSFGAIDMYHLKNRIGLLTGRGVEVILVLDACRTNELAGGYASQAFNSSIMQTRVGEIAMLATGPGQVSIEDASIGNGHGLFTYNLIDGLSGLADKGENGNNDQAISFLEIKEWVSKQVMAMSGKFKVAQNPVFCCDDHHQTRIGIVDSSFSLAWNQLKRSNPDGNTKGITDNRSPLSSPVDTALLALYNKFNTARKENNLWGTRSADDYYEQMANRFPRERITEDAQYALAAAFINFAQQKINLYLEGKDLLSVGILRENADTSTNLNFLSDEYDRLQKTISERWTIAGWMVQKAGKLLAPDDTTILRQLKPKINFLLARGYLNQEVENNLSYSEALQFAREAYLADSSAAYTTECLALMYAYRKSISFMARVHGHIRPDNEIEFIFDRKNPDTALYYFRRVMVLAPKWINSFRSFALKMYGFLDKDSAIVYLKKGLTVQPNDALSYRFLGELYKWARQDSSVYFFKKAISLSPASAHAELYNKIVRTYLGYEWSTWDKRNEDSIMFYSRKALAADPKNPVAYMNFGGVFIRLNKTDSTLKYYKKAIQLAPEFQQGYYAIARIYINLKKRDSVLSYYHKIFKIAPNSRDIIWALALFYDDKAGNADSAIYYYEKVGESKAFEYSNERLAYLYMAKDKNDSRPLEIFNKELAKWPSAWREYFNIACYYANRGEAEKSVEYLEKAIQKGMKSATQIRSDPWISLIKDSELFKNLMAKYFPG